MKTKSYFFLIAGVACVAWLGLRLTSLDDNAADSRAPFEAAHEIVASQEDIAEPISNLEPAIPIVKDEPQVQQTDPDWQSSLHKADRPGVKTKIYSTSLSIENEFGLPITETTIEQLSAFEAARLSLSLSQCAVFLYKFLEEELPEQLRNRCENVTDEDLFFSSEALHKAILNGEAEVYLHSTKWSYFVKGFPEPIQLSEMFATHHPLVEEFAHKLLNVEVAILGELAREGFTDAHIQLGTRFEHYRTIQDKTVALTHYMVATALLEERGSSDEYWENAVQPLLEQTLDVDIQIAIDEANHLIDAFNSRKL